MGCNKYVMMHFDTVANYCNIAEKKPFFYATITPTQW